MKSKELAAKYGVDKDKLERFIRFDTNIKYKETFTGFDIPDGEVVQLIEQWNEKHAGIVDELMLDAGAREKLLEAQEREEQAKQAALSRMLISSGFSFDGYRIVKYSGYISGDDVVQVDRGFTIAGFGGTNVGKALTDSLVSIRRQALKELKEAAYDLGCNAVVGVDFDYITLDPQTANFGGGTTYQPYIFCVTANGNAVVIERIED